MCLDLIYHDVHRDGAAQREGPRTRAPDAHAAHHRVGGGVESHVAEERGDLCVVDIREYVVYHDVGGDARSDGGLPRSRNAARHRGDHGGIDGHRPDVPGRLDVGAVRDVGGCGVHHNVQRQRATEAEGTAAPAAEGRCSDDRHGGRIEIDPAVARDHIRVIDVGGSLVDDHVRAQRGADTDLSGSRQ